MATSAQALFDEANCYTCLGVSSTQALILALEARWLLSINPAADVGAASLMGYGPCLTCHAGGDPFSIMETALLDQISEDL